MKYILSIDQGTTSSRAFIINQKGDIVGGAQKEFTQHFPKLGYVEHDPLEIWSSQQAVIHEALAKASIRMSQIAAIGITNQRETTVVWDKKTSKPLYRAIVWQDRRTSDYCAALKKEGHEESIRKKTGLLLDPYFSASKIRWILDHIDGAQERAEKGELAFGTIDTWLIWKLSGGQAHVTDVTNASRTMLYNIYDLKWDEELLSLFNIPSSLLPKVVDSSGEIAITEDNIPITGLAGDQQASLFGQGCFKEKMAKITYGTGSFILINTGNKPIEEHPCFLTTLAYKIGNEVSYALEGSVFMGGSVVQWLRDSLNMITNASEVESLAKSVEDTNGVYFVPSFTGLGAPHWDSYARGMILGLTRGATKAHIARAAIEGIAHQVTDILENINYPIKEYRVDGGGSKDDFLMEMQASLQNTSLVRMNSYEVTAIGAAYLAGLAIGFWKSREEIHQLLSVDQVFKRTYSEELVRNMRNKWKKAVDCAKSWHDT